MKKIIIHLTCSDFGKRSNIGYRSYKIYTNTFSKKENIFVIARRNKSKLKNIITTYPVFLISRIFNLIRSYFISTFPSRHLEVLLFNFYTIPYIIYFRIKYRSSKRIIHLWDTTFWFAKFVKKLGFIILLDISMTPSYSSIEESIKNPKYYQDRDSTLKQVKEEKKIMKMANLCICPSEYTGEFIKKNYDIDPSKIKVVPFGADPINFEPKYINNNASFIKLGYVGLINKRKGIRWLIDVLNKIKKDNPEIKFELNLYGRIFKEEFKLIRNAKFKINAHGFVRKNENIFTKFHILVHPSFIEGSAKCIYEGLSFGLPVICTKQSGSIVKHGYNGYIVEAGNSKKLNQYLLKLISNKSLVKEMGKNSKILSSKYTWEIYANKVSEIYIK